MRGVGAAAPLLLLLAFACSSVADDAPGLTHGEADAGKRRPFALVHPVTDHTKLSLDEEGLALLQQIEGPVAPVVVIGPYRSGKSFTLNQLLELSCDEGFGVGHTRLTQTKGVWVWGEPVPVTVDGTTTNLLFIDTEGFESTGKADVYDDRIFALAAVISSVLVYNLPESIRESDLEKLSFAVELGKAFYSVEGGGSAGAEELPVRPGSMVWLIQRDFLKGSTLATSLQAALKPVPNPHKDEGITQLNRIRDSLHLISSNSTAIGLPQPHLDRTRLCELGDDALDAGYKEQRGALRDLVRSTARPKVVQGQPLTGAGLADLIRQVVTALNEREIPTANSLVEYFNRELVQACRNLYVARMEELSLPVDDKDLKVASIKAEQEAEEKFERGKFGGQVGPLREALQAAIEKELGVRTTANTYESTRVCERAELACEEILDRETKQNLPSMGRFEAHFDACKLRFNQKCIGPAWAPHNERLQKAYTREHGRFAHDYNERLLNGLVLVSLFCILVFRFVIRLQLGETLAWVAFVFLQVYPKTFLGEGSMFSQAWWGVLVQCWEAVVYNPVMDLGRWGLPVGIFCFLALLLRRWWLRPLKSWWRRRYLRRPEAKQKADSGRDLNV